MTKLHNRQLRSYETRPDLLSSTLQRNDAANLSFTSRRRFRRYLSVRLLRKRPRAAVSKWPARRLRLRGGVQPSANTVNPLQNPDVDHLLQACRQVAAPIEWQPIENPNCLCYRNATFQMLLHLPSFVNYLTVWHANRKNDIGYHKSDIAGETCGTCPLGDMARSYPLTKSGPFDLAVEAFWNWAMPDWGNIVKVWASEQNGIYHQQDSAEFIGHLLDRLRDFNKFSRLEYDTLFKVRIRQRLTCSGCLRQTDRGDNSTVLSIPIPTGRQTPGQILRFSHCIDARFDKEEVERNCDHCGAKIAMAQDSIRSSPEILLISLNRFTSGDDPQKKTDAIMIPSELDLSDKFTQDLPKELVRNVGLYRLAAMVSHIGEGLSSGHYIASVKDATGSWYDISDTHVRNQNSMLATISRARAGLNVADPGATPYVLAYVRQIPQPESPSPERRNFKRLKAEMAPDTTKALAKKLFSQIQVPSSVDSETSAGLDTTLVPSVKSWPDAAAKLSSVTPSQVISYTQKHIVAPPPDASQSSWMEPADTSKQTWSYDHVDPTNNQFNITTGDDSTLSEVGDPEMEDMDDLWDFDEPKDRKRKRSRLTSTHPYYYRTTNSYYRLPSKNNRRRRQTTGLFGRRRRRLTASSHRPESGYFALENPNNLCYRNATLIMLMNLQPFGHYLFYSHRICDLDFSQCLLCQFRDIFEAYWSSERRNREDFQKEVNFYWHNFDWSIPFGGPSLDLSYTRSWNVACGGMKQGDSEFYYQQDAQEYLTHLIGYMANNTLPHSPVRPNIKALFHTTVRGYQICGNSSCGAERAFPRDISPTLFTIMPEDTTRPSLEECLKLRFAAESRSGIDCTACHSATWHAYEDSIERLPAVLLICIPRLFPYGKDRTIVDVPAELDMAPYVLGSHPSLAETRYRLQAMVHHCGPGPGGHFIASVRHQRTGRWFDINDYGAGEDGTGVTEVGGLYEASRAYETGRHRDFTPYLLAYVRVGGGIYYDEEEEEEEGEDETIRGEEEEVEVDGDETIRGDEGEAKEGGTQDGTVTATSDGTGASEYHDEIYESEDDSAY